MNEKDVTQLKKLKIGRCGESKPQVDVTSCELRTEYSNLCALAVTIRKAILDQKLPTLFFHRH